MDEMHIKTKFTKAIIAKIIGKLLKSKLGIAPAIELGDFDVTIGDDKSVKIHLNLDAEIQKDELSDIITALI